MDGRSDWRRGVRGHREGFVSGLEVESARGNAHASLHVVEACERWGMGDHAAGVSFRGSASSVHSGLSHELGHEGGPMILANDAEALRRRNTPQWGPDLMSERGRGIGTSDASRRGFNGART